MKPVPTGRGWSRLRLKSGPPPSRGWGHCVTASFADLGVGRGVRCLRRNDGGRKWEYPHPRIKYGAGSNPLPGRERGGREETPCLRGPAVGSCPRVGAPGQAFLRNDESEMRPLPAAPSVICGVWREEGGFETRPYQWLGESPPSQSSPVKGEEVREVMEEVGLGFALQQAPDGGLDVF